MARPLWVAAGVALLGIMGGAGILIASSGGEEEASVQQGETATAEAGVQACDSKAPAQASATLWRWGSAIVEVPEGLRAVGRSDQENIEPVLELFPEEDPDHGITIHADTGETAKVGDDDPVPEREAELQAAAATVRVCPLDPNKSPWPYKGGQSPDDRLTLGNVSYLQPDPRAGIQILSGLECGGGCRSFVEVRSAHSWMAVDSDTGRVWESTKITPEDQGAFDTYLATIQVNSQ